MTKRPAADTLESPRTDGPQQPTIDGYQIGEFTNRTAEEFENDLAQFDHNNLQERLYYRGVAKSHVQLRALIYEAEKEIDKQKSRASQAEAAKDAAEAARGVAEAAKETAETAKGAAETKLAATQGELVHVRASGSCTPFAVVLIDGDGYIFDERLIQQGTTGGELAAHHVHKNIQHYFRPLKPSGGSHENFDGASNWRIVVKIYMNLDGLAKTLYRAGRITNSNLMQDFAIGFNQCQPLFEIVDVGRGKERTDYKFKANFELYVPNTHCKHLVLGCAHDHGYIPMLDQYKNDKRARGRITILHTEDVAQGYQQLPFNKTSFIELFKSSATLNSPNNSGKMSPSQSITRQPTPPTSPTDQKTTKIQLSGGLMSPQSPGNETSNRAQQQVFIYPRPVAVNKNMERVDQDLPPVCAADAEALKKRLNAHVKPCNEFNLVGRCSSPKCQYDHEFLLPEGERRAYARTQRTKSCRVGARCSNEKCMYGHMCQYDAKSLCSYGERCRFKIFHGMDTAVFKEFPVTGSGSVNTK